MSETLTSDELAFLKMRVLERIRWAFDQDPQLTRDDRSAVFRQQLAEKLQRMQTEAHHEEQAGAILNPGKV